MRGAALAVATGGLRLVTGAGGATARFGAPHGFGVQVAKAAAGTTPDWSAVPKRCSFKRAARAASGEARVLGGRTRWAKCLKALRFKGGHAATLYVRVRARAEEGEPFTVSSWSQPRAVALKM